MNIKLNLREHPTQVVIETKLVDSPSGSYVQVNVFHLGKPLVDHIPDMYPGDKLELTLRF